MSNGDKTMSNLERWNSAKFTRSTQIESQAAQIMANRSRYDAVSAKTGVPWDVIAVIHYRESSCSFSGVLHNGERIIGTGRKTTLVPKGRGPFQTWEQAAIDALVNCAPYAAKNKDWSLGNTLDVLEAYNGLGYRKKGLPSPYLWAGTDQYTSGKYVADGKFDPNTVDKQLGAAAILMAIRGKAGEQTVAPPVDPTMQPAQPPKTIPKPSPAVVIAATASVSAAGALATWWHDLTIWIGGFF